MGQSLCFSASGMDAPEVHFVRCDETADEVNIVTVRGPGHIMVVYPRLADIEPLGIASVTVRQENGISRSGLMISDLGSVRRPCGGDGFGQEWPGVAAQRGSYPDVFIGLAIVGSKPDLTSVI